MQLIFLYGLPAVGKLTIGREVAARTGYKLFHNHLAVDLLLSTFDFGSGPFIELREQIWLSVFRQACQANLPGMVFTFNPETTVRRKFIKQTVDTVHSRGGKVSFVELVCPLEELKRRIEDPARQEHGKLNSAELFEQLYAAGAFDASYMPKASLTLDTSQCGAEEAAEQIVGLLHPS